MKTRTTVRVDTCMLTGIRGSPAACLMMSDSAANHAAYRRTTHGAHRAATREHGPRHRADASTRNHVTVVTRQVGAATQRQRGGQDSCY